MPAAKCLSLCADKDDAHGWERETKRKRKRKKFWLRDTRGQKVRMRANEDVILSAKRTHLLTFSYWSLVNAIMPLNNLIILNKVAFTMSHDTLRAHTMCHIHTFACTRTRTHIKEDVRKTNTTCVEPHFFAYASNRNTYNNCRLLTTQY